MWFILKGALWIMVPSTIAAFVLEKVPPLTSPPHVVVPGTIAPGIYTAALVLLVVTAAVIALVPTTKDDVDVGLH